MNKFSSLLYGMNQALRIKDACDTGQIRIPPEGKGKQTLRDGFKVGDSVVATGMGTIKRGVIGVVSQRYKENGYWYYEIAGMGIQRQQDLVAETRANREAVPDVADPNPTQGTKP
jgi:hypothetical protein